MPAKRFTNKYKGYEILPYDDARPFRLRKKKIPEPRNAFLRVRDGRNANRVLDVDATSSESYRQSGLQTGQNPRFRAGCAERKRQWWANATPEMRRRAANIVKFNEERIVSSRPVNVSLMAITAMARHRDKKTGRYIAMEKKRDSPRFRAWVAKRKYEYKKRWLAEIETPQHRRVRLKNLREYARKRKVKLLAEQQTE